MDTLQEYYHDLEPPQLLSSSTPRKSSARLASRKPDSTRSLSNNPANLPGAFYQPSFVGPHFQTFGRSTLTYKARLLPQHPEKTIFEAACTDDVDPNPKRVVVKFARYYSKAAHEYLQKLTPPLAPKLLYCEKVEMLGDWWAVVMEYIESKPLTKDNKEEVKASVEKAMKELHDIGFVHGDLRDVNVLVQDHGAMIVDFDWADRVEEAKYPILLNEKVDWPEDATAGGPITKEHDEDMLKKLKTWVDSEVCSSHPS